MLEDADFDINVLVSNVVGQKRYSHCRLCLKEIQMHYLRFQEPIILNKSRGMVQPLHEILNTLFGDKITEEVPGIDAVCEDCAEKGIEAYQLIQQCRNSSLILERVFSNILDTLNIDLNNVRKDKSLYISVNEDSECLLFEKENEVDIKYNNEMPRRKKKTRENLRCLECDEVIENVATLKIHNLSYHDKVTCDICYETFHDDVELETHVGNNHVHQCPDCGIIKTSAQMLKNHQDKLHNHFVCKECGKSFQGLDRLYAHEKKHALKNKCPKCGKYYATKEFYAKHVKLCLENRIDPHPFRGKIKKTHFCDDCNKGYSTEGGLRVHKRFVHGNAKPHVCPHCGKEFTAPSYLKTHMVTHTGEKNFKCDICNNRFVSKEALLYHTRRHTGEKPYSCNICNEKFVNASARAEHTKFRHVGPTLMCDICSRKFVTANFLKQHMSRHHDPASKLYMGRSQVPPNMPGEENMRIVAKKENSD